MGFQSHIEKIKFSSSGYIVNFNELIKEKVIGLHV